MKECFFVARLADPCVDVVFGSQFSSVAGSEDAREFYQKRSTHRACTLLISKFECHCKVQVAFCNGKCYYCSASVASTTAVRSYLQLLRASERANKRTKNSDREREKKIAAPANLRRVRLQARHRPKSWRLRLW